MITTLYDGKVGTVLHVAVGIDIQHTDYCANGDILSRHGERIAL